uniref:Histone H1 n=1 Tax=Cyprinus carpio TaxID=7962 RepID=A0A8C1R8B4_CYPCA
MAETAPAATATKAAKKKSAVKRKRTGPSVGELIVKAVSASKERSGVSLAALKKALAAGGYDVEKNNSRVKIAVKSLVTKGILVQTKGIGASGSFKLNKKQRERERCVRWERETSRSCGRTGESQRLNKVRPRKSLDFSLVAFLDKKIVMGGGKKSLNWQH